MLHKLSKSMFDETWMVTRKMCRCFVLPCKGKLYSFRKTSKNKYFVPSITVTILQTLHFLVNIGNLLVIWIIFVMLLNKVFLHPNITYRMAGLDFKLDEHIFHFLRAVFLYTVAFVPSVIIYEWRFRHTRLRMRR